MPEKSVKIAEVVFEKPPPFGTNRSKTEMLRPPDASRNSSNQSGSSAEGSGSRKSMGHKLKKLFTFGGRKGRRREVWGSNIDETVFDSPLQEAIAHLTNLGGRLGELELEGEQRLVSDVIERLHSPELHGASTLKTIMSKQDGQIDSSLKEWLVQMEWLKDGSAEGEIHHAADAEDVADAAGDGRKKSFTAGAPAMAMHESSVSNLISPLVRPKLTTAEVEVARMLEHGLDEWEFDVLQLSELTGGNPLAAVGWAIAERHGFRHTLGVSPDMIAAFLQKVEATYRDVPYHNSAHGACVTHGTHWLLSTHAEIAGCVETPLELFTTILAAICHDLDHDGRNNAFHVATSSPLALLYSDVSVLEMHHLSMAFSILQQPDSALLSSLPLESRKEVRRATPPSGDAILPCHPKPLTPHTSPSLLLRCARPRSG